MKYVTVVLHGGTHEKLSRFTDIIWFITWIMGFIFNGSNVQFHSKLWNKYHDCNKWKPIHSALQWHNMNVLASQITVNKTVCLSECSG